MSYRNRRSPIHKRHELHQRANQLDVDIKRLWKQVSAAEQLVTPDLQAQTPTDPPPGNILIYVSGVTTAVAEVQSTTLRSQQMQPLNGTGLLVHVVGELDADAVNLSTYDLIYVFHTTSAGSLTSTVRHDLVSSWLEASPQRRLIISGEWGVRPFAGFWESNDQINAYLTLLGASLQLTDEDIGFPVTIPLAAPSSHYLVNGLTGLSFSLSSKVNLGTPLLAWSGSNPGTICSIEKSAGGSEIILIGDSSWAFTFAALNGTWINRLYPSAEFGGVPVQ